MIQFSAILKPVDDYPNAAYIEIPAEIEKKHSLKGRIKIKATFDGIPYRGSLVKMKTPCYMLIVVKEIRKQLNKNHGDTINVTIEIDTEKRKIDLPVFLINELKKDKTIEEKFYKLSYSHQKEYVNWLINAKKEETKQNRLYKLIEMIKSKK